MKGGRTERKARQATVTGDRAMHGLTTHSCSPVSNFTTSMQYVVYPVIIIYNNNEAMDVDKMATSTDEFLICRKGTKVEGVHGPLHSRIKAGVISRSGFVMPISTLA